MNESDIIITESSDNVFVDPGFDLIRAGVMKLRAEVIDPHRHAVEGKRLDAGRSRALA